MSLAISWECWNSAQSILMQARAIAEQRLGHRLHYPGLARAGGPEEKQIADGTPRRVQAGEEHLVDFGDFFDRDVLAHDLAADGVFKVLRVAAATARIEGCIDAGFHNPQLSRGPVSSRRRGDLRHEMGEAALELFHAGTGDTAAPALVFSNPTLD